MVDKSDEADKLIDELIAGKTPPHACVQASELF